MSTQQICDSLWVGFNCATMEEGRYSSILDAAIAVHHGNIIWIGERQHCPDFDTKKRIDLGGGWVTPGLIDCHTHAIFGGNRSDEFELRLNGASYEEIAAAGGGIASSVKATRLATETELFDSAAQRLRTLAGDGVTTVEIKSGYGLNLDDELKMLRVARQLGNQLPLTVKVTCLAAHTTPPEFMNDQQGYIDLICKEILPVVAAEKLADAVDAFCEGIAFSTEQVEQVFAAAQQLGLPVKLHAEQLSSLGGSSLAARYQALSADHLEYVTEDDVKAMAQAGTVAVVLPGAFYFLRETKRPPIELLRHHQVPIAVATDLNPGTSPALSLRLMMNMSCTLFGLTPEEALAGVTCHAATALGMADSHGSLAVGKTADFVCFDVDRPADLSYWLAGKGPKMVIREGKEVIL